MTQQAIPGFKILMFRNVPPGSVLSSKTADLYALIESGSWISNDENYMIQIEPDGQYKLFPLRQNMHQMHFYELYSEVKGTLEEVQEKYKLLQEKYKDLY